MTHPDTLIVFTAAIPTRARPDAVLAVLRSPHDHLAWAGTRSTQQQFRLLALDADDQLLSVGSSFTSTGAASNGTFHDRSVVVVAQPGEFAFCTTSRLDRRHGAELRLTFDHRYEVHPSEEGSRIVYSCRAHDANYVPYWLRPGMRSATRWMIQRLMVRQLGLLAAVAEESSSSGLATP